MDAPEGIEYKTTGRIAAETGHPVHKIIYAIKSRKIQCIQRAGQFRLYSPDQVREIVATVEALNERTRARLGLVRSA